MGNSVTMHIGELLIESRLITHQQLEQALVLQKNTDKKLEEILIDENIIKEKDWIQVLSQHLEISYIDLDQYQIDPAVPNLISEYIAKKYTSIPVKKNGQILTVAMIDPLNIWAIDDIKIATGLQVETVLAAYSEIRSAIVQYYDKQMAEEAVEEFKNQLKTDSESESEQCEDLTDINHAPVVKLINSIISQAVKMGVSDIHIEPFEERVRVRFRIDGVLQERMSPDKQTHHAIAARVKIMAKMDIAEKRIPQDGRVEMAVENKEVDLRISILPTIYGEKIVIRILDRTSSLISKEKLGFTSQNLKRFDTLMQAPNGIILVTGPTGSGKSTTLYTALKELNTMASNIITVEDPVEYKIDGINQVQVNNKAGLTFASSLRSILRQDPDIIMIGEIRDTETAQIATRAAITGHLVLATMHTNDTSSTVARLVDMEIEPYLVSSAVVGVIAQRLVRRICNECKISYSADKEDKTVLGIQKSITLFRSSEAGCSNCNGTGYKGRIAVHEILFVTKEIRILIEKGAAVDEIRNTSKQQGMVTLRDTCKNLVLNGMTTVDEMKSISCSLE